MSRGGGGASRGSGGGASSGSGWLSWGGGWLSWGTPPLSLLSLFVLGFRVTASLLDHHKKGPTPPFTTRQGPNVLINDQTRPIHDFAVSFLYYCEFNYKRIIIFIS